MSIASKTKMSVILAIGQRVPRWPECHIPEWANPEKDLIPYIKQVVKRYKGYNNISYWQVENEPFLHFGVCKRANEESWSSRKLQMRKASIRGAKYFLPVEVRWAIGTGQQNAAAFSAQHFYRKVYNRFFGQITYPITSEIYPLKRDIIKFLTNKPDQNFIIIELGTEPWGDKQIIEMTLNEQLENFSVIDSKDNIDYALKCRFDTYYLWGAEWCCCLKKKQGINGYWNYAAEIFHSNKMEKKI